MVSFGKTRLSDPATVDFSRGRRSALRSFLASAVAFVVAAGAYGCSPEGTEDIDGATNDIESKPVDPNRLLEDDDILGGAKITPAEVQKFLDSHGSVLATYKEGGETGAEIIVKRSQAKGVSPVYMLARIQGESGLIEDKTKKDTDKATGCGCPDGKGCSAEYKGFANQITCAANLIQKYYTQLDTNGKTTSGWEVGVAKQTQDPCTVTPANKATAAFYTYTPWVGAYASGGCGSKKWAGSSGMAKFTVKYRVAFAATDTGSTTPDDPSLGFCDTPAGKKDPLCCVPKTAAEACATASKASGAECGRVSDGCTGTVSCDDVPGFGCTSTESCKDNRCQTTQCVPKPTADLCAAARSSKGVTCGKISDGCGGEVDCDKQEGFGCATGKICNAQHKCVTDTTLPSPGDETKSDDTDNDDDENTPADEKTKTKGAQIGPASNDDDDKTSSTNTPSGTGADKAAKKKKQDASSGGCNAAPGNTENAGLSFAVLGAVAILARRRRRS